jgi:hypothetical protein
MYASLALPAEGTGLGSAEAIESKELGTIMSGQWWLHRLSERV